MERVSYNLLNEGVFSDKIAHVDFFSSSAIMIFK